MIPVLVDGARMPDPARFPSELRKVPYLNAATVRADPDFHNDVSLLLDALRPPLRDDDATSELKALGQRLFEADTAHKLRRLRHDVQAFLTADSDNFHAKELLRRVDVALVASAPPAMARPAPPPQPRPSTSASRSTRSVRIGLAAALALVAIVGMALVAVVSGVSRDSGVSPTPPPDVARSTADFVGVIDGFSQGECDAAAWDEAAKLYASDRDLDIAWIDPDRDCLHSDYETNSRGSPPTIANEVSPVPGFGEQFREGLLVDG